MKAIIEIEFNKDDMIDDESLFKDFGGDLKTYMKLVFEEEGMGIFEDDGKLIDIKE